MKAGMTNITELPYSAGLMSQSFWFLELKKIVRLVADGRNDEEIKTMCSEQNFFGAVNEYRAKRIFGYLISRVNTMDSALIDLFLRSDITTQKLINLITILRGDRLLFEFLNEVYREKAIIGQRELEAADMNVFFSRKEAQDSEIEAWKESTKRHLKSNYINFMLDANLLAEDGKKRVITPPLMDIVLERKLCTDGEESITKAITGVR